MIDRYVAMEKFTKKATADEGTAGKIVFSMDYNPLGVIASAFVKTTGVPRTISSVKVALNATSGKYDISITVASLAANDIVSAIAFA